LTMALALVIARSTYLRESLAVLLQALPLIGRVVPVADIGSALALGLKPEPGLVLWDCDLPPAEVQTGLAQLKAAWPQARRLALVDDEQLSQETNVGGADVVLVKGVHAARLLEAVEKLIVATDEQSHTSGTTASEG